VLINDAYNANPVSMAMALEAVAARRGGGRAIVVLGEMAELGPDVPRWHAEAARHATQLGIDVLLAVGDAARRYLEGATAPLECCWLPDTTAAAEMLTRIVRPGDVVLLKGSRAACLERVAEAITRDRRARPRRGR
jgi:UDP-N-acetylmuramoyl-tripeptide--D-alanyl-D-alanine ligase